MLTLAKQRKGSTTWYAVVAFPNKAEGQGVGVSVAGQAYALQESEEHPNLYVGNAPFGQTYNYVITDAESGTTVRPESVERSLADGQVTTGNEFFDRFPNVYSMPELPQAFNPIYPPLFTNMNKSNEVATLLLRVDTEKLDRILVHPKNKYKDAHVYEMTYISNSEIHTIKDAGIINNGQTSKEYDRQSFEIDLNKYVQGEDAPKQLLFGRSMLKLRAEPTDPSFMREKLVLDCLAAAGAATLSGSWVRLFVNDEAIGLFLMTDDVSTHFIDDVLNGGDWAYPHTGPTYKGNALDSAHGANLAYLGDDVELYSEDVYKLKDKGKDKQYLDKDNKTVPLIEFTRALAEADTKEKLAELIHIEHTMIHLAVNFLVGSWDGVWYQASNFYLNQDLGTRQWTLITYDFDETLGNGVEDTELATVPYQSFAPDGAERPLIDAVLRVDTPAFERILKTLVKRFFKPSVIEPRLKTWQQMLEKDLAWDRGLPGRSPGEKMAWTYDDFYTSSLADDVHSEGAVGNSDLSLSIADWVRRRSAAVCEQLNIDDTDDIVPALGPYIGGHDMDGSGLITEHRPAVNAFPTPSAADRNGTTGGLALTGPAESQNIASSAAVYHPSAVSLSGFVAALAAAVVAAI
ncbi:coth protein-domain-containing protein [Syncephalastrum racemosum]|uniref:Coth protein-domain-containing protein n=1 Tax=Syncephalastrum racemosum TaxID=13706 RepID=A0A1X2HK36_SYNRA|nr:coth protein-domain-containing protein [Syncephalastrum racemosum]